MISAYWSLKLSDYGLNTVLDEMAFNDVLSVHEASVDGKLLLSVPNPFLSSELMHIAPELIMDRRTRTSPFPASMPGDVYTCGCVLYQILNRQPLIPDQQLWPGKGFRQGSNDALTEFLNDILTGNRTRPVLVFNETQTPEIVALIRSAVLQEPNMRPSIRMLAANATSIMKLEFV
ncbi:unnamed protein product [Sphagnum balticum]